MNWKIHLPVICAIALGVARIWAPDKYDKQIEETETLLMAFGVISASRMGPQTPQPQQPTPK